MEARVNGIIRRIRGQENRMLRPSISEQPGVDRGYELGSTAGEVTTQTMKKCSRGSRLVRGCKVGCTKVAFFRFLRKNGVILVEKFI